MKRKIKIKIALTFGSLKKQNISTQFLNGEKRSGMLDS